MDAVICRTLPHKEYDLLVRCYTREAGSTAAVARGALRPGSVQGMHLAAGTRVRFALVPAKGFPIITGAQTRHAFRATHQDVRRRCATWVLLEAVDALVRGPERDEQLWDALTVGLEAIDTCVDTDLLSVLRRHERTLLSVMGYAPRADECGACGIAVKGEGLFSVATGSVICGTCGRKGWQGIALQGTDMAWLAGRSEVSPGAVAPVRAPTEWLLEHLIGAPLRSLELLFRAVRA